LLPDFVKSILRFLGFDRAVSFGILARLWSLVAGPVTMLVIATGFSPEEQGFYYTFSSLLALQIFFDLGLMFVISQFTSHEFVHLTWGSRGKVVGEPAALKRFTDLLCKSVLWFGVAALLMIIVLVPAGFIFFGQKGVVGFPWRLPWTLAVIGTALNLFVTPFFAIIMGSGDVVTANKRDLVGAILSSVLCWLVIGLHGGLYAVCAVNVGALVIAWGYLLTKRPLLVALAWEGRFGKGYAARKEPGLSWWGEIWPMQWRIAISAGASYFMFQLFNPILFHYHGPVAAGRMGMTMSAANALLAGCMTLLNAKTPEFGKLIALNDWTRLDREFTKVTLNACLLAVFGMILGIIFILILQINYEFGNRFLPVKEVSVLFATICIQILITALAIYLRAHKKEPLMRAVVLVSMLQVFTIWFGGKFFGSFGVVIGYFCVTAFFMLPSVLYVWKKCRTEWHDS
jgi:O-antigen/teichoic acid export membrane protein